jgi:ribosomal protein S18 acetylase RimI-like enzyme
VDTLDYYIGKTAMQHGENGIARTFVLVPEENKTIIVGYYTLTTCDVRLERLKKGDAKGKPRSHPIPAGKLARLAVSLDYQKQGLGKALLTNAMGNFLQAQDLMGMCALFVDAIDENAACFYRKYGFIQSSDDPLNLYLPTETIRKAFTA